MAESDSFAAEIWSRNKDTKPTCETSKMTAKILLLRFTGGVGVHGQQVVF